ncbi:hypothetical protein CEG14_14385 [Bordetella genomosp. 1]|uniref:Autotransporter domain-containing protein n=1 Tax=Bordetella genomosp. 1 TaxID=1395607 RepID=A0A261SFK6_9BORD|nr:hypothetical protein CEG14_14385 [Bordetella genomosp. 1]
MALAKAYLRLPQTLTLTLATAAATAWVAPAAQAQSAAQLIRAEVNRRAAEGVAMGQTGSLLLLESELGAASQRQGELRNGGRGGLWARAGGSRFKVDGDDAGQFDNDVGYGAIGGDYGWDLSTGKLYLGAFVGLGSADQDDNDIMKGKSRTKYLGTYLTYVDTSGFYVDAVSKVGRIKDEVKFDLPATWAPTATATSTPPTPAAWSWAITTSSRTNGSSSRNCRPSTRAAARPRCRAAPACARAATSRSRRAPPCAPT